MTADFLLPPLRGGLKIHRGPADRDGAPTWTLHDPAANRFFRLGWPEAELLAGWGLGRAAAVAAEVGRRTPLRIDVARVRAFLDFLARNQLLAARDEAGVARLLARAGTVEAQRRKALATQLLFFRLPLVRPDRLLDRLLPWLGWMFSRPFVAVVAVAALAGLYLTVRQWDLFAAAVRDAFTVQGAALGLAVLTVSKVAHEFGHALAAKRHGCPVPTMGVAFLVFWPVLYTDTTAAWTLARRRPRLEIALAGVGAEMGLAALATLSWSAVPDGPARTAAVLAAAIIWVTSLAVNLNPLMKFDGYYLLADLLDVPNLQPRAFALARWRLREALFGWREPPPERFPPGLRRGLLVYAYAVWVYRLGLYAGIAAAVYGWLFKLAGLALLAFEMSVFVAGPVLRELGQWWARRARWRPTVNAVLSLLLLAGGVGLLVAPLRYPVSAPAMLQAARHTRLFAPTPARVVAVRVAEGDAVAAGTVLIVLDSPALVRAVRAVDLRLDGLRWELDHASASPLRRDREPVLRRELAAALAERDGLMRRRTTLTLTAPFAGTVTRVARGVEPGGWVDDATELVELIDPSAPTVEAYVAEADLETLSAGARGRFVADDPDRAPLMVVAANGEPEPVPVLGVPALASLHGGPVPCHADDRGRPVPDTALYRVRMTPLEASSERDGAPRALRGAVALPGRPRSLAGRAWRHMAVVVVRESGF